LSQLSIDGAPVAASDSGPVLERPQLVIRVVICIRIVDEDEELLNHRERVVVLTQGKESVWAVTLLRRRGAGAINTNGVAVAWGWQHDLLDADLVAPGNVEVVLVGEALARPKAEISQANLVGVVGKADPTEVGNTIVFAVDDELVEV